jgi:hypothetical protein
MLSDRQQVLWKKACRCSEQCQDCRHVEVDEKDTPCKNCKYGSQGGSADLFRSADTAEKIGAAHQLADRLEKAASEQELDLRRGKLNLIRSFNRISRGTHLTEEVPVDLLRFQGKSA